MTRASRKVALVTGALSGIGKACAERLGRDGFLVAGCDIGADGGDIAFLDVCDAAGWQRLLDDLDRQHGRLDVLVNAAGVSLAGDTVGDCTAEIWNRTMSVNLDGPFLGMKHAIPKLRQNGRGAIVNIGSIVAHVAEGEAAAYVASKGALRQLTKSVALHLARSMPTIRCNMVSPGYTRTPLLDAWIGPDAAEPNHYAQRTPMKRLCTAEEVAGLVAYLCSDAASAVTGSDLLIDGGYTAQ